MAARTRSTSPVVMPPSVPPDLPETPTDGPAAVADDLVLGLRSADAGQLEAVPDLDALDGLDAHERAGQAGVEPPVAVHEAAQARGQAVGEDLDHPAEGVAGAFGLVDLGDHRVAGGGVQAAHRRVVDPLLIARAPARPRPARRTEPIETTWLRISTPATCRRNARATVPIATRAAVSRALARSSTGRASSTSYFCMPARSAWPGRGRVSGALRACSANRIRVDRVGRHHRLPLGPFGVADADGHRAAHGQPVTHAAGELDLVLLELHAGAAAVARAGGGPDRPRSGRS